MQLLCNLVLTELYKSFFGTESGPGTGEEHQNMYEGESFSRQIYRQEESRKKKRKKIGRRILAGIMTVALISGSIVLTERLLLTNVLEIGRAHV